MSKSITVLMGCVFMVTGLTAAAELQRGNSELSVRANYTSVDLGSTSGFDLGTQKVTELGFTWGYLFTDSDEFGLTIGYDKQELSGSDFLSSSSIDGSTFGGFYDHNFKTGGSAFPYLGVGFAAIGGDLGDAYSARYGVTLGMKIYPFEHGLDVGIRYNVLKSKESALPDANAISIGVGLLIKF